MTGPRHDALTSEQADAVFSISAAGIHKTWRISTAVYSAKGRLIDFDPISEDGDGGGEFHDREPAWAVVREAERIVEAFFYKLGAPL